MNSPFQNYGAAILKDQEFAERLRRALDRYCFDGTECHGVVNAELRGLENEIAAANIRHAVVSQFRNCIPLDAVVEVIGQAVELTLGAGGQIPIHA